MNDLFIEINSRNPFLSKEILRVIGNSPFDKGGSRGILSAIIGGNLP
jgi:hypothetical protein